MNLKILFLIIFISFLSTISYAQYDSIPFDGYNRTYLVHLPTGYTSTKDLPLVIVMHGGFGNAYTAEKKSQFSLKADAENFIVVYPEGIKGGILNISSWNAGWCCGFASKSNINDVGFIDSLLNTLISKYSIDTNRIYATGMSNGGFMAYRLACELFNRIAAIAPVASSMSMKSCTPSRPVPIIHFHSYIDSNIPYLGGVGNGVSNHYNSPQDSVMNAWANINNCSVISDTIINNAQYTVTKWTNCDCGTEIYHYLTQDGGHSWPGGVKTPTGDPGSKFINATDLIWSFFQQHTLNCSTTSINEDNLEKIGFKIFPNPTNGKIIIHSDKIYQELELSVFTTTGNKILTVYNQTDINLSFLAEGIYFIQIKAGGKLSSKKIIKIE